MKTKKGQLTQRDIKLIEYCRNHLPITSDIAGTLFYPNRYIAQRRLNTIHHLNHLNRTERLIVNQPYIYYHDKRDLPNFPFTKLLYDLTLQNYEIIDFEFNGEHLQATIERLENTYKINTTLQNLSQVYKRLALIF